VQPKKTSGNQTGYRKCKKSLFYFTVHLTGSSSGEEKLWGFLMPHSLERENFMRHKAPTGSLVGAAALEGALSS